MNYSSSSYATPDPSVAAGSPLIALIWPAIGVVLIVAMWKLFTKAGKPGWMAIVPFLNTYILLKIAGRPGWWLLLFFVPLVNLIILLIVSLDIAKAFGKSATFGVVGLWLFSIVGYMILAFDKSTYTAPAVAAPVAPAPTPQA